MILLREALSMYQSPSLTDLLRQSSMTEDTLDLRTLTQLFLSQMRISLYGGASSIPMLPTFLDPFGPPPQGETVAVAVLDDREVRVCLADFSGEAPVFREETSFPIPGREYPAPLDDVLYAVAELAEPLLGQASRFALCLPFPVDYDGKGDGCIRRFPGSMTVSDFAGRPVLALLRAELQSRGCPELPMVLVSEADAVLLAAGAHQPRGTRCLGLTWGSTVDLGFTAPGSIVLRWPGIDGKLMLFDGGFSSAQCVPFGMVDYSKDRDCYGPGQDLYLKMVSTDYLGEIYRLTMIKAAERKLLSFGCSRDVLSLTYLGLDAVLDFLDDPIQGGTLAHFCREPQDREVGLAVAQAVLDRAARLVCANLSAVLSFVGAGRDPETPAWVGVWGEAFQSPRLRALLETHLHGFTRDVLGLHAVLSPEPASPAMGAALAACYHS